MNNCKTCGQDIPDHKPKPIVRIVLDHHRENPLEGSDIRIVSFNQRHHNFAHPDTIDIPKLESEGYTVIRLSYFEHGNSLWFRASAPTPAGVEFQWDGVRIAGLLIFEPGCHRLGFTMEAWADDILEEYSAWCNGECYGFSIEDPLTDDELDSCYGYIGYDNVLEATKESLKGLGYDELAEEFSASVVVE